MHFDELAAVVASGILRMQKDSAVAGEAKKYHQQ
jgi:hypothetical protein